MPPWRKSVEDQDLRPPVELKVPQVRVLQALYGEDYPALTRAKLSERAGYTELSGTVTRALNGLREGNSSSPNGKGHLGLVSLGMVRKDELDVDGLTETVYEMTPRGKAALEDYWRRHGKIEVESVKKKNSTNWRYIQVD